MHAHGYGVGELLQVRGVLRKVERSVDERDLEDVELVGVFGAAADDVDAVVQEQLVAAACVDDIAVHDLADLLAPTPLLGVGRGRADHFLVELFGGAEAGVQHRILLDLVRSQPVEVDKRGLPRSVDLVEVALHHDGAAVFELAHRMAYGLAARVRVDRRVPPGPAPARGDGRLDDEIPVRGEPSVQLMLRQILLRFEPHRRNDRQAAGLQLAQVMLV